MLGCVSSPWRALYANSVLDLTNKTALASENAPIDIPERSTVSAKPYWYLQIAMKVNIAEANIRSVPRTENLKRFLVSASIPPAAPNIDEISAKAPKSRNPRALDVSAP